MAKLKNNIETREEYFRETVRLAEELTEKLNHLFKFRLFPLGFTDQKEHVSYKLIIQNIKQLNDNFTAIVNWHDVVVNGHTEHWIESVNFCFSLFPRETDDGRMIRKRIDCDRAYQGRPGNDDTPYVRHCSIS